jgi:diguanylate cyclase (GGDEF)-like protein
MLIPIPDFDNHERENIYIPLLIGLIVFFVIAYVLNYTGLYYWSAGLTIISSIIGPWASLILDPFIRQGDLVPLTYVALPVLLSSLLVPPIYTIVIAIIQFVGLHFLPIYFTSVSVNWPSLIIFYSIISGLSLLANFLIQRDIEQINHQTKLLAKSEKELRELAFRDYLTETYNRRYMEEALEREIQRAERKMHPIGIIMLDIDHFKLINDTYGHSAGDSLLRKLGEFLIGQVRPYDIVCRYGGEEFVLIMPEYSLEETKIRAEIIRGKVKNLQVEHNYQTLDTFTISFGVAAYPNNGLTCEMILKSVDQALYQAKQTGRDRVIVANNISNKE